MYATEEERKKANIASRKKAMLKRAEKVKNMSQKERSAYYRSMYERTSRIRISREKHIRNAITFLESLGYKVI